MGDGEAVLFAAAELRRYLARIAEVEVVVAGRERYDESTPGIWLGEAKAFGGGLAPPSDHPLEDTLYLKSVRDDLLILSGSNPRSVLYAAYAYLESLGCRFVRMGVDGEILPRRKRIELGGYNQMETASYRFRGVCIEGSLSREQGIQLIDYLAKKRFNTYFIQFRTAYIFWSRWYDRGRQSPQMSVADAEAHTAALVAEIKKRGLALQMVGHGWTNESLGVQGLGWYKTDEQLPREKRELLAEVDGVRDWWGGIPINTELCLSNPVAFNGLVEHVVDYAARHPEVDHLHLWMSDGHNNRCSCAECAKRLPSEWYVDLLNAIDERLTERSLDTRIVFLIYFDLLWAPRDSRLANPDRFILMFAPITRSYRNALSEQPHFHEEQQPFRLNQNIFPKSTAVFLQYLDRWQKLFRGDSFTYDYHFLWMHSILEPTGLFLAEILHKDIVATEQFGMQGIVNCQVQKYFFPTGLAMEVSGRTMWDKSRTFAAIRHDYFADAFGVWGAEIEERMAALSPKLDDDALYDFSLQPRSSYAQDLEEAERILSDTLGFVSEILGSEAAGSAGSAGLRASLRYLRLGLEFMGLLLPGFKGLAGRDFTALSQSYRRAKEYLQAHEAELETVCDTIMWGQWLERDAARAAQKVQRTES